MPITPLVIKVGVAYVCMRHLKELTWVIDNSFGVICSLRQLYHMASNFHGRKILYKTLYLKLNFRDNIFIN